MSAILLPFDAAGAVDWDAFARHVERTCEAGLTPAVNMDTGYVQLLDEATRLRVLEVAKSHAPGGFVGGAQVPDAPGDAFDVDAATRAMEAVAAHGGTPILFPSHGLNARDGDGWVEAHAALAERIDRFLGFELGPMFVPYGRIYDVAAYRGLLGIPACVGAKHSSLSREAEWERLAIRDAERPDFLVLTGNDLAIDMVTWGSDYLLGLSTFAPDAFARRDACWEAGDARFYEWNDWLQYLGHFAFRPPVPGYKHDAAMFLHLRGQVATPRTHPGSPRRPRADVAVLGPILARIEELLA